MMFKTDRQTEQDSYNLKDNLTNDTTEPNTAFLNELKNKLPQFFDRNGDFDIGKFQEKLSKSNVNEIRDGYTLNYVGKTYARLQAGQPTKTVIIPDGKHNKELINKDSKNVFLTGDNLDVLKHLQKAYTGEIDFIYIDPPYNTGSDGFVYTDRFDLKDEELRDVLGFSDAEIERLKILNGRSSHSAWLTFMYPRLKIAQQLLADTGVIFVSIDDNEQANLKLLMDDVFGEGNFVANLPIIMSLNGNHDNFGFSDCHEYTLVYGKNINETYLGEFSLEDEEVERDWLEDDYGLYKRADTLRRTGQDSSRSSRPKGWFPVFITKENEVYITHDDKPKKSEDYILYPISSDGEERSWSWGKDKITNEPHNLIVINTNSGKNIYKKQRPSFGELPTSKPKSFLYKPEYSTSTATITLAQIFDGKKIFTSPKPVPILKDLIEIGTKKDSLILDFFAGSATTADAVMQLNAEDGGSRRYIMATLDEPVDERSVAKEAGYETIDQISRERIKRAAKKIKEDNPDWNGDVGFKHFYVNELGVVTVDKLIEFDPDANQLIVDDMVSEFAREDLETEGTVTILQTWLINDGYTFDVSPEIITFDKKTGFVVDNRLYIIDGFTQDDVAELLNKIGKGELGITTIIVFGYSVGYSDMVSLQNNVKTALEGVKVEVRW